MKKPFLHQTTLTIVLLMWLVCPQAMFAQCNNADFEDGTLSGWTGTYGNGTCTGTMSGGNCSACYTPDPFQHNLINQGPNNQPATGNAGFNHFIMSSGYDPIAGGNNLPVVYNPGSYSIRLGDAHANDAGHGGGESIKYRFTVTPNNCNFIYHYAVVLKDGGHTNSQQPYFKIGMTDGNNNTIDCATYDVDATTAQTIGGFVTNGSISYKTWSTVSIPLNAYMGQSVSIVFSTRDCAPNGCEGSHWAYAYIDAQCSSLDIGTTSPTICTGQNVTLTAPDGAASYSWTGPGIVSGANSQQCVVNLPGDYQVDMTTFGTVPCDFTLTKTILVDPNSPVANFTPTAFCAGVPTAFTDISTPVGAATSWAWDFNSDGITDATAQNPSYTFATAGTYPVRLQIGAPPCIDDTTINVTVAAMPTSAFTAASSVCAGANSLITYTGTAPSNAVYTWNFAGGTVVSGSGQGPYQVNWLTGGVRNVTLSVAANGCSSVVTTVPVTVNAIPVVAVNPDVVICTGESTTLTASGAANYNWSAAAGLSSITGTSVTASPVFSTTYSVTGTSSGCSDSASVTVTVNPVPVSNFTANTPVCVGENSLITYTGTTLPNAAYTWNFAGGTVVSGSGQGPYQVNWSSAGVKNVTLSVTAAGCTSPPTNVRVTVNPIPVVTVSPDVAICAGESTALTASGAGTYNWAPANGLSTLTGANVTAAPLATTTYRVTGTSLGCSDSVPVTVTVNPIPVVTVSPNVDICAGANAVINASGANTYSWSPTSGLSAATGASVTATPASAITYSVTGTSLGCSASTSVTVTVKPIPNSSFTASSPVCAGADAAVTYTGSAPSNAVYNWNFAGGTIMSGAGQGPYQVRWSTGGTKNVTLTVTLNGCTSPVTTVPVTVNAIPVVMVTPNIAICAGAGTTLTASGANTYNWSPSVGLSGTAGASLTAAPVSTTTYSVTGTSLGCVDSASVTVSIKPIPTSAFTAVSPVCAGANSAITYTGSAPVNATYTWNFAGGTVVSGSGQGPYQVKWATGGIKNVTLVVTLNGCSSPLTTVPVTVNAIPVITLTPNVAICAGESTTLTASGAGTYSWAPATGLSANSGSDVTATPVSTITYTVTGTTSGCSASASVTVTVNPIPVSAFTATSPVCEGANAVITYTGTAPANAAYNWNFAGGTIVSGTGQGPYQVKWATDGIKNVTLSVTSIGCASPVTTVPVTVNPIPVVTVSPNAAICAGEGTTLTASGASIYSWIPAGGLNTSTGASAIATPAVTTTYTVTGTSEGCSGTATVTVAVTPVPVAAFSPQAGQCITANSFGFQASGSFLPSATFAWDFGTNANPATSTSKNQNVVFSSVGSHTVSLTITQNGCVSNVYTDVVNIYSMPVADFTADTLLGCQNLPVCFTANSTGNGPLVYQWNFGDGVTSALQNPCHTYPVAGDYTVTLQVTSAEGCKDDSVVPGMIQIIANPVAAFSLSSTTIQLPSTTVELANTSQHAVSYLWLFGDSLVSTVENPGTVDFTAPGYYPVSLYAYNELGCVDSAQKAVTVYQEEVLFVPNAFTPNGDGNNDYFEIYGKKDGWEQIEVTVFDRWGEKVFESNDLNFKWDGTYKGENMMGAVFVYLLRIVYTNNHADKLHKGSLTMVR